MAKNEERIIMLTNNYAKILASKNWDYIHLAKISEQSLDIAKQYIAGKILPSLYTAFRICVGLDVSLKDIYPDFEKVEKQVKNRIILPPFTDHF